MITEEPLDSIQGLLSTNNLVVTGKTDIPVEIRQGDHEQVERLDLWNDLEGADVIISHYIVQLLQTPRKVLK
jgi:hypothetical protein